MNVLYDVDGQIGLVNQQLTQDNYDLPGSAEPADQFGTSLEVGDFNRDFGVDLVIGVPFEDMASGLDAGAATVLYGAAPRGVFLEGGQLLSQASLNIPGLPERADGFGSGLAAGDFNGDATADVAIGVPGEGLGSTEQVGAAVILHGSQESGLLESGSQLFTQDSLGVPDAGEPGDGFGAALGVRDGGI